MGALLPSLPRGAWILASTALLGFVMIGWLASSGTTFPISQGQETHRPWGMVWQIFAHNTGASLLLFAGVATGGIATLASLPVLGMYIGTVVRATSNSIGMHAASEILATYFVLEFIGLALSAVCGVAPLLACVSWWRRRSGDGPVPKREVIRVYLDSAGRALRWMVLAELVLLLAAWLEVLGGIPR
ncbi:stage II sporulation protein M [Streptomyces sp. WM4235]|uniref:stage II sporulation protein M n=1 Tax=Streptomyces sp. WM4235 TaxID=1415551 RepID=UPI00131BAA04|nr:stage II sporulation protein M [Streptomyces sp. WM4235]